MQPSISGMGPSPPQNSHIAVQPSTSGLSSNPLQNSQFAPVASVGGVPSVGPGPSSVQVNQMLSTAQHNTTMNNAQAILDQHINAISKDVDIDISDEEESSFKYLLSTSECMAIRKNEFIDFSTIYRRVSKKGSAFPKISIKCVDESYTIEAGGVQEAGADIPFEDWIDIFTAFQAEYVKVFPQEAHRLPKYFETVRKLAQGGGDWLRYDVSFRTARARKLARNPHSRSVMSWAQTDFELFLACQKPVEPVRQQGQGQSRSQSSSKFSGSSSSQPSQSQAQLPRMVSTPDGENYLLKFGTCWAFQTYQCRPENCKHPSTHNCYRCQGSHSTRQCNNPSQSKQGGSQSQSTPETPNTPVQPQSEKK